MSIKQERDRNARTEKAGPFDAGWKWRGGGIAGLIATMAMGAVISVMDLGTLRLAIAGLYGQPGSLVAGWAAHLVHGTLFGIIFALLLSDTGLYRVTDWHWKTIVAGFIYGMILAIAGAGIIMPIWLGIAGFSSPPSIPNITPLIIVWHLIYGLVLGAYFRSWRTTSRNGVSSTRDWPETTIDVGGDAVMLNRRLLSPNI